MQHALHEVEAIFGVLHQFLDLLPAEAQVPLLPPSQSFHLCCAVHGGEAAGYGFESALYGGKADM
eukprot:87281-Rhodomonas_salina.1